MNKHKHILNFKEIMNSLAGQQLNYINKIKNREKQERFHSWLYLIYAT